MDKLWCVTALFNPAGYRSRLDNYHVFRDRLDKQNINLLTVELAFHDQEHSLPKSDTVLHLRSNSVMWQKERLLNYAINQTPDDCTKVAWLDSDLLLPDGWDEMVESKLEKSDFVQLFEKITNLAEGETKFDGNKLNTRTGIVWQSKLYGNDWIPLRLSGKLFHSEPGFGWAAKKSAIQNGLYDRLICGSGDNWLADCILSSFKLHHYLAKLTDEMKSDMDEWKLNFNRGTDKSVDYLPIGIYHLWHGSINNRGYKTRDLIFKPNRFDPKTDIKMVNNVWEWATDKPHLHQSIIDYFRSRKEDGEAK
jgi:hypothetical protein